MNLGTAAAEAPTPTYDAATGNSAALGSSPRARRSLDMGGGRRAAAMLPDYEGDVDHFVLPASIRGSVIDFFRRFSFLIYLVTFFRDLLYS